MHVATNVVSGRRYVFAPFYFNRGRGRFEEALEDLNRSGPDEVGTRSSDVGLFDAAVAGASFPNITPSQLLSVSALDEKIALVDGGYVDYSGAETARDVVMELQESNVF